MISKTIGFIGGGRITRIILEGFRKAGIGLKNIIVSDTDPDKLNGVSQEFPNVKVVQNGNRQAVECDIVFVALHPPAIASALSEVRLFMSPASVIVSLAPKLTIAKISELTNGAPKLVRMIPNAPSIVGRGFNPVAFSEGVQEADKAVLNELFASLGEYKIVQEKSLEAYAILTAMGPTYFWFQLFELQRIVQEFGLTQEEAAEGIRNMVSGAVATMYDTGMTSGAVMDLVPAKPIGDHEEMIKSIYREKLKSLYEKIKP